MRVGHTALWLVKSSGRVLGPFTDRQVSDLLKNKVIVPLDEISKPFDRWGFIRDRAEFARLVEEIRIRNLSGALDENTTRGSESTSVTLTSSVQGQSDDLTVEISTPNLDQFNTVQDVLFQSVDDAQASANSHSNQSVFVHENNPLVQKQSALTAKWVWLATLVIILGTAGVVIFQRFVALPHQNKVMAELSETQASEAFDLGNYAEALEQYERAFQIDQENTNNYYYLGLLKIQEGNQPFQGRKILERLMAQKTGNLKKVRVAIGHSYLKEGNFKSADSEFNKALDEDPLFTTAVINLGVSAIYQEDWPRAVNHLLLAAKDESGDGAEYVMLTEVMRRLYEREQEKRYLSEAQKYLKTYLEKSRNYYLENSLGLLYIDYLLGEAKDVYERINAILELDFDETEQTKKDILIHRTKADWSVVSQWCLRLTKDLDPSSRVLAFEAICLFKSGDIIEAERKMTNALAMDPLDPLVLSVSAYIQSRNESSAAAEATISKAISADKNLSYLQPLRLKAKLCLASGDLACQEKYWLLANKKDPHAIDVVAALAQLKYNERKYDEARKYLDKGLSISSQYKPFLSLERRFAQELNSPIKSN